MRLILGSGEAVTPDELLDSMTKGEGVGGPYMGPRGGKWADSGHTIPWDEKEHGGGKTEPEKKKGKGTGTLRRKKGESEDDYWARRRKATTARLGKESEVRQTKEGEERITRQGRIQEVKDKVKAAGYDAVKRNYIGKKDLKQLPAGTKLVTVQGSTGQPARATKTEQGDWAVQRGGESERVKESDLMGRMGAGGDPIYQKAPKGETEKSQNPQSPEEEERMQAKKEEHDQGNPPPLLATKKSSFDELDDLVKGGKPGESLEETSTKELTQTHKDILARLKSDPKDAAALESRRKAIVAELGKRTPPDFGGETEEKGCATPGMKIRSGGKGRGEARGGGKGPINRGGQGRGQGPEDEDEEEKGGCATPGMKIRSGGRGRGEARGGGRGPINRMARKSGDAFADLEDFAKGGPYIGPRGGKWADVKHTIAWEEGVPKGGKTATIRDMSGDKLHEAARNYKRVDLEGGEGYNPYTDEIDRRATPRSTSADKLAEIEAKGWTREVTKRRQAEWAAHYVNETEVGWTFDEMRRAARIHGLLDEKKRDKVEAEAGNVESYGHRPGLEGPFEYKTGRVLYFDLKEEGGKYYDPKQDRYLETDEALEAMGSSERTTDVTEVRAAQAEKRAAASEQRRREMPPLKEQTKLPLKESTKGWKQGDPIPNFKYSYEQAEFEKPHPEAKSSKKRSRKTGLPASGGSSQGQIPGKSMSVPSLDDWMRLEKGGGGPFIGPRGGKWADTKHTIPWSEEHHGKPETSSESPTSTHAFAAAQKTIRKYQKTNPVKAAEAAKKLKALIRTEKFSHYKPMLGEIQTVIDAGTPSAKYKKGQSMAAWLDEKQGSKTKKSEEAEMSGIDRLASYGEEPGESLEKSGFHESSDVMIWVQKFWGEKYGKRSRELAMQLLKLRIDNDAADDNMKSTENTKWNKFQKEEKRLIQQMHKLEIDFLAAEQKREEAREQVERKLGKSQSMPKGNPKQGLGQGEEQGGNVNAVGKTSGSGDSAPGPGQDKKGQITGSKTDKAKLSEDDEEDENQMGEHKKPIETAKSVTPARQRDMVAQEQAQAVSKLRKGEDDVEVGVGLRAPQEAPQELEKAQVWGQGMVQYGNQSDLDAERLLKSDNFYTGSAPQVVPLHKPIQQFRKCASCGATMAKSLTACPECGAGVTIHRVMPGGEAIGDLDGEPIMKSGNIGLQPAREKELYLPDGVKFEDE